MTVCSLDNPEKQSNQVHYVTLTLLYIASVFSLPPDSSLTHKVRFSFICSSTASSQLSFTESQQLCLLFMDLGISLSPLTPIISMYLYIQIDLYISIQIQIQIQISIYLSIYIYRYRYIYPQFSIAFLSEQWLPSIYIQRQKYLTSKSESIGLHTAHPSSHLSQNGLCELHPHSVVPYTTIYVDSQELCKRTSQQSYKQCGLRQLNGIQAKSVKLC